MRTNRPAKEMLLLEPFLCECARLKAVLTHRGDKHTVRSDPLVDNRPVLTDAQKSFRPGDDAVLVWGSKPW
jgi:hypothetical protein